MKIKKYKRHKNHFLPILLLIIFFTWNFINFLGRKITDNITVYVIEYINKQIDHYVFYSLPVEVAEKFEVDKIISLTKNTKGEIISVDYQMDNIYVMLAESLSLLYESINDIKVNINYLEENKDVLWIPLGIGSDNIFVANFGPKIPIKLNLLINAKMGYKTKVTNYGINNILLELYLVIDVKNNILTPVKKEEFGDTFDVLIASRVITGTVPSYYNGVLENSSPIIDS